MAFVDCVCRQGEGRRTSGLDGTAAEAVVIVETTKDGADAVASRGPIRRMAVTLKAVVESLDVFRVELADQITQLRCV